MRHKIVLIALTTMVLMMLLSCASLFRIQIPEVILNQDPDISCDQNRDSWAMGIKAILRDFDDISYVVIHFDPIHRAKGMPNFTAHIGSAVFEGRQAKKYYYRLGKLPKTKRIGLLSYDPEEKAILPFDPDKGLSADWRPDKTIKFILEKEDNHECLKIYKTAK